MERNLADALRQHARNRGTTIALIDGDRRITYAELDHLVDCGAQALIERGCQPTEVVGLSLKDHWAHIVMMYACMRAGVVMLPLDVRWTAVERRAVVEHFGAVRVICEPDAEIAEAPCDAWPAMLDGRSASLGHVLPQTDLESPLLLSLSSGTTGRPKGPRITHRHFLRRFYTHWINLGLNARSRYVCATPLYFGGGRTFVVSVLFSGGQVSLCVPPFEPQQLADHLREHQANALFLVPTQLRRLLQAPAELRDAFRKLDLLMSSGAPLQPNERLAIVEHLCPEFREYYASTEGGGVTLSDPQDLRERPSTVGRPIFGVEVQVVDADDRPLPAGEVGTLRYRGPGVADSFFQDPEQTAIHFRGGWFYPGDLGEIDPAGYVFLRGRSKDMIIRGGVNIYPNEIEDVLMQLPEVRECSVLGLPDTDLGESVACAWSPAGAIDEAGLIEHCRRYLAPYKVPARWMRLDNLPVNSGGKVVKAKLREMFGAPGVV
jgi:acyl-CoA synthetase (AMP-forming)/AMP-acid ligase II